MKFLKPKIYKLKTSNKWTLAYIHPDTNKRIRKRFERRRDALIYLNEISYSFIQEKENFLKNDKISKLIDDFTSKYPETIFYKTKKIANLFIKEFKDYYLHDVTLIALKNWFIKIRIQENYSLKSLSNYQYQIGAFFGYLVREGYIAESPLKKLKFCHRIDIYKRNYLSQEDMEKIFEYLFYMSPYFLYRLCKIIYYTGLSRREVSDLLWEHIDLKSKTIAVIHPKSGFSRHIRICHELMILIEQLPRTSKYFFVNRFNRKIDHNVVIRHMQRFRRQYPHLKFIDFDVLRDTAGFHFLERGGSLEELRNNLNHSNIEITKRLYTEPKKKFYTQTTATKEETMSAAWGIEIIK